jgi:predicted phosphodiesterase
MSSAPVTLAGTYARIGVIGDIHTRADRLEWALSVLREEAVERVLATGDVVDGPYPETIGPLCELLRRAEVLSVLGNHDRWLLDEQQRDLPDATYPEDVNEAVRSFLLSLPQSLQLSTPSGQLLLGHGLGSNDMTCLYPYDHGPALRNNTTLQSILKSEAYRYVVSGHTHMRMVRRIEGVTFVNAGALHYTREPCCLLLDFETNRAQFFEHENGGARTRGPSFAL